MSSPYANAHLSSTPEPGNPRRSEAWALTEAGRRLASAARDGNPSSMRDALRLNWRLWTIFQASLVDELEKNTDDPVRINLLTLCQFIDKHTVDSLVEPTAAKLQVLVDINRNIAAGLTESVSREEAAQSSAPAGAELSPPQPMGGISISG